MLRKFNQHDNEHFFHIFSAFERASFSYIENPCYFTHLFLFFLDQLPATSGAVIFEILLLRVDIVRKSYTSFIGFRRKVPLKRDEDITISHTEIFRGHDFRIKCVALQKFEGVSKIQNSFPWPWQRFSIFPPNLVGSEVGVLDPFSSWQRLERDKHVNSF